MGCSAYNAPCRLSALLASLLLLHPASAATVLNRRQQPNHDALRACLEATHVATEYPSEGASITTQSQNTNYDYTPFVVVRPTSTEQVASIVRCVAADKGATKVSTFGGGHGYASYALGGADGFVVIDSSLFDGVTVDKETKTARVSMSARLGPLAMAIGKEGFGLPHGTCPSVGVFGHALGGGWGFSSRKWGWLLDHIIGMTLVDPAGNIRELRENSTGIDADLWWSTRGAGANNFGVVTVLTFALSDAPAKSVNFKTTFPTNNDCATALRVLADLGAASSGAKQLPSELGLQLLGYGENGNNPGACSLVGQFLGPIEDFKKAGQTIRDNLQAEGFSTPDFNATEFPSWVDTLTDLMGNLSAPPTRVPYYAKSLLDDGTPNYSGNVQGSRGIFSAIQEGVRLEDTGISLSFDLNGPLSETNNQQPYGDSAAAAAGHRDSLFLNQLYVVGYPSFNNSDAQNQVNAVTDKIIAAVRANDARGAWRAYVNYVDPRLENWAEMYYGDGLWRLKQIKGAVDPDTLFDFPQGLAHT